MSKPLHTPTPWEASGAMLFACTRTVLIVDCASPQHPNFRAKSPNDNAAYIARAINSHEALLKAIRLMRDELECYYTMSQDLDPDVELSLDAALEALRLAETD